MAFFDMCQGDGSLDTYALISSLSHTNRNTKQSSAKKQSFVLYYLD